MRNRLLANWSTEATPAQWRALSSDAGLPVGGRIYVPALPKSASAEVAAACTNIRARGYRPVPHLAARAMRSRMALGEWLERMRDAGADAILLIAGDRGRPAGAFRDTLDVLDTGLVERSGFRRIAVAGHPEGHAKASDEALLAALRRKAAWARETGSEIRIVTQFAFSAAPVINWYTRMSAENIGIPLRIGVPGPAKIQTLLRYAAQCGVGASTRMLMRRPGAVSRLLGRWSPQEMIDSLADGLSEHCGMPVEGLHVFPFGGLSRTVEMFTALKDHAARMQRTAAAGA